MPLSLLESLPVMIPRSSGGKWLMDGYHLWRKVIIMLTVLALEGLN
ncbi:hypothetical protein IUSA1_11175 [Streptococcus iniae IUSA1]|nr:hypothetical protein IUSA1_11175 [Streptococcus iniae IUSA1]